MNIAVFGNANAKVGSFEWEIAEKLGEEISKRGFNIVTGGYGGVMEAAFKNANNCEKIAVIIKNTEPNNYATKVIKVENYLARLLHLIEISNVYIILPGGTGTLLEFAMVWALKERNLLGNKTIIVIGEEWHELMDVMSFYNETVLDNIDIINKAENINDIIKILDNLGSN